MPYERSLDQNLPFEVEMHIEINEEQMKSDDLIHQIIDVLKENDFHPSLLTIDLSHDGERKEIEIENLEYK